ncbi:MAG TPA: hypothetical protein HA276_01465 [Candidatus Poseidoniaceae archaeon]|nr:MAG: hypothetical protein CBD01_004005 [Euryarchaeota archaeon TMED141]DAC10397.1 MAG TPA: hypothetical protein D7I09_03680 [Candidatus Poseidoniales archaeon]DAC18686.1 MAG TPA: hypothetical protein D7I01_01430 [Candidatus Poseidoniales archaeon]HII18424.1 hypothetical protein [Candidatus Poseidoniaceae archaeon]HII96334.1 hypothetical protein [Candidatus Poseidoniaceae archaeon]
MVGEVEVSRVGIRDGLSVDLAVQMEHPGDYDFRPSLHFEHTTLIVRSQTDGSTMAEIPLDQEQINAMMADRAVTLRVKFSVTGMHGRLNIIHPIVADGKAKKLANANWKTTLPVHIA